MGFVESSVKLIQRSAEVPCSLFDVQHEFKACDEIIAESKILSQTNTFLFIYAPHVLFECGLLF
jgi:hypothetical protein